MYDMYDLTVPQFTKMLGALSELLDKAAAYADTKKFDVGVLLNARLAPDQFHLIRQIQITTDAAKGAAARAIGKDAPKFEDNEKTIPELKERIAKTITYLQTIKREDFKGVETRMATIPWMPGKGMPAQEFVQQLSIPNFYFHMTTAYSILRHNGMAIGKGDFLGGVNYKDL